MEALFQTDFSAVRIHETSEPAKLCAVAMAVGWNLYFVPGRYNPETALGQELLGHELAHVVQQISGRALNPFGEDMTLLVDRELEAEADQMGLEAARIFQREQIVTRSSRFAVYPRENHNFAPVAQCKPEKVAGTEEFTDSRNPALRMPKTGDNQYRMPNGHIYVYHPGDGEHTYLNPQKHSEFYDPVHMRVLYETQFFGSRNFRENYYYVQEDKKAGDCFIYDGELFKHHDLISNFGEGDLLYGTEHEREKVREQIKHRINNFYMTADDIHREIGIGFSKEGYDDGFRFRTFDPTYEEFLASYKNSKGQVVNYHPLSATTVAKVKMVGGYKDFISKKDRQIRRSCKALLAFMLEKKPGMSIHFITDNLTEANGFTDSEKRHIMKRGLEKNAKLKFYKNGVLIACPWRTY